MKFAKVRSVKSPCRGTQKSSGIDLFVPNYNENFVIDFKSKNPYAPVDDTGILVHSLKRILIPSGIKIAIPDGYDLVGYNKSGVANKKGLILGACVIDNDYEGEIYISLINASDETQKINFGEKIIQVVLREVSYENVEEVSIEDLTQLYNQRESERKEGGFGSTGSK